MSMGSPWVISYLTHGSAVSHHADGLPRDLSRGWAPEISVDPDPAWIEGGVQDAIAVREYRASSSREALQAPNRVHRLRTFFEPRGIRVYDRTAPGSTELLEMRLATVGRQDALQPVPAGEVTSDGTRVEIRRTALVEWCENSAEGLVAAGVGALPAPASATSTAGRLATPPSTAAASTER